MTESDTVINKILVILEEESFQKYIEFLHKYSLNFLNDEELKKLVEDYCKLKSEITQI